MNWAKVDDIQIVDFGQHWSRKDCYFLRPIERPNDYPRQYRERLILVIAPKTSSRNAGPDSVITTSPRFVSFIPRS
jgi:hypothetical protein